MILEEYLTKLGFQVDEPSFKKFLSVLTSTGARTAELGALAVGTAVAIEAMVTKVARQYETLYYASQRTNKSVQYLQSTQFAFKQIGLSAEEANSSIEGIAATMRTQPWLKAIFGNASTPQEIATRLGNSGLPYFLQVKFAEMVGLSEKTLFQMQRFAEVEAAAQATFVQHQREAGLDPDDLADKGVNLARVINQLEGDLEILGDRFASDFFGPVSAGLQELDKLVLWITRVDKAVSDLWKTIGLGAPKTEEEFKKGILFDVPGAVKGSLGKLIGALKSSDDSNVFGMTNKELGTKLANLLGPLGYELGVSDTADLTSSGVSGTARFPSVGTSSSLGHGQTGQKAQQFVDMLVAAGYPLASARGIVAGMYSENTTFDPTAKNPTSGMTGLFQWDTNRRKKFKELYNKDVSEASDIEQMQFGIWELSHTENATGSKLRAGGLSEREAASTFLSGAIRPGAGLGSDLSRALPFADSLSGLLPQQTAGGDRNVTQNNTNHITIHDISGDPNATGRKAGEAIDTVNSAAIRNMAGIMR